MQLEWQYKLVSNCRRSDIDYLIRIVDLIAFIVGMGWLLVCLNHMRISWASNRFHGVRVNMCIFREINTGKLWKTAVANND